MCVGTEKLVAGRASCARGVGYSEGTHECQNAGQLPQFPETKHHRERDCTQFVAKILDHQAAAKSCALGFWCNQTRATDRGQDFVAFLFGASVERLPFVVRRVADMSDDGNLALGPAQTTMQPAFRPPAHLLHRTDRLLSSLAVRCIGVHTVLL